MSVDPAAPPGRRERKKQQTRDNISDHATRLFLEHGFDKVTIAQIAEAADVAKMTVTNYFPRKEDLALDMNEEFVGQLARVVREREEGVSAAAALRQAYAAAVADHDPVIGFSGRPFAELVAGSPALMARLREFHDARESALAGVLAEELANSRDDLMPKVYAAQLSGVLRVLFEETMRRTLAGQSNRTIATALRRYVDQAFDSLEPSLGSVAVR